MYTNFDEDLKQANIFFYTFFFNCPVDICRIDLTLVHWKGLICVQF